MPHTRSHLHSVGPHPSHASFNARSSCPHMRGNSSLLETNVAKPSKWNSYEGFNLEHCEQEDRIIHVQGWSLQCPSNMNWSFKIYLSQNNPSKRNPISKMKTSLEVLNIICPPWEPHKRSALELSFNSSWLLIGSWLFCFQNFPCLVSIWCMRGCSVEVWTKNILYWFMKGQTHFGMPRGAKMSLALHEPI
jgi:hypothetical protein